MRINCPLAIKNDEPYDCHRVGSFKEQMEQAMRSQRITPVHTESENEIQGIFSINGVPASLVIKGDDIITLNIQISASVDDMDCENKQQHINSAKMKLFEIMKKLKS